MNKEQNPGLIRPLVGIIGSMVVFACVLIFLAMALGKGKEQTPIKTIDKETEARIAPVGQVATATNTASSAATSTTTPSQAVTESTMTTATGDKGKTIYDGGCVACHSTGVAGAPKVGDKDAWTARIGQGNDTLYEHAIKGFQGSGGIMPPKGGLSDIPDEDIKAAVDYMVNASK